MTSKPDNSLVDDLLNQLSESFFLDEPIAGNRLGDLLRAIENFHDLERLDDDLSLIVLQRRLGMGSSL